MYAAYNAIHAQKTLYLALDTGHWEYPEQNEKLNNWVLEKLLGK
jgi:cephalosporin-C deacetylase-like acetyl esterase